MDARLSFMARAEALHMLVERGEMGVDEAFDKLFGDINERRAIGKHFDEILRKKREKQLKLWRESHGYGRMLRMRSAEADNTN